MIINQDALLLKSLGSVHFKKQNKLSINYSINNFYSARMDAQTFEKWCSYCI